MPGRADRIRGVSDVTTYVGARLDAARSPGGVVDVALRGALTVGEELVFDAGQARLAAARDAVEASLAGLLRGRAAITLLLGARSISPRIWTIHGAVGDDVQPAVRSILELAIQKHATWRCSGRDLERMPSFLPGHLAVLAKAFALSEVYAGLLVTERRVCKGQSHTVSSVSPLGFDTDDDSEVARLIEITEARSTASDDLLSMFGTISAGGAPAEVPFILAASWVPPSDVIDGTGFAVELTDAGQTIRTADRTTRRGFIDGLGPFQESVAEYDQSLRATAGYGLIDLHAVQHLMSIAILERYVGEPSLPPAVEFLGLALVPPEVSILFRDINGTHPYDAMEPGRAPTMDSMGRAFDRLLADPKQIELDSPQVRQPLLSLNEQELVYDLSAASLFSPMFIETTLEGQARQDFAKDFEKRTHASIADLGVQPWPSGRAIKKAGRWLTDVDASVLVGSLLVVADCYSSPWTRDLDRGHIKRVRSRADHLVGKLEKWQRQWLGITQHHPELLPSGVDQVLPVVVTSGPEWIPSERQNLWLTPSVPAILTGLELRRLLRPVPRQLDPHLLRVP